jgi:hypothetical protein
MGTLINILFVGNVCVVSAKMSPLTQGLLATGCCNGSGQLKRTFLDKPNATTDERSKGRVLLTYYLRILCRVLLVVQAAAVAAAGAAAAAAAAAENNNLDGWMDQLGVTKERKKEAKSIYGTG